MTRVVTTSNPVPIAPDNFWPGDAYDAPTVSALKQQMPSKTAPQNSPNTGGGGSGSSAGSIASGIVSILAPITTLFAVKAASKGAASKQQHPAQKQIVQQSSGGLSPTMKTVLIGGSVLAVVGVIGFLLLRD